MIHPTALVDPQARVADSCYIGPYCVVEAGAVLQEHVALEAHVVIKSNVTLQAHVHVHSQVVLGDDPQIVHKDFSFPSGVQVGAHTIIREGATIHRASQPNQMTMVGEHCLLMAYSHVGHDVHVGNHCILANQALLAGCVTLESHVFVSGGAMVHQFVHIGESAFISGNAEIGLHVPPFVTMFQRNCVSNLNVVGLQRRHFSSEEVVDIKKLYRLIYDGHTLSFKKKAQQALEGQQYQTERGHQFLAFFVQPKPDRGFAFPPLK